MWSYVFERARFRLLDFYRPFRRYRCIFIGISSKGARICGLSGYVLKMLRRCGSEAFNIEGVASLKVDVHEINGASVSDSEIIRYSKELVTLKVSP